MKTTCSTVLTFFPPSAPFYSKDFYGGNKLNARFYIMKTNFPLDARTNSQEVRKFNFLLFFHCDREIAPQSSKPNLDEI